MKNTAFKIALTLACAVLLVPSCKKDKDKDTVYKYVTGTVSMGSAPAYVLAGDVLDFNASGGVSEDGSAVRYCWTCNPFKTEKDTLKTGTAFSFTVPSDTLCSFTITLSAFAEGHIGTSITQTSTIVDPALGTGSLTGITVDGGTPSFTDSRDGKKYFLFETASLQWFRQNLAWEGAGKPFQDCAAMNDIYGRYYSWNEAQSACPSGWRVPSEADWREIAVALNADPGDTFKDYPGAAGALMANAYFNGERMWGYYRGVSITDKIGFSALPTGFASIEEGQYRFKESQYGMWWTSATSNGLGVARYLQESTDIVFVQGFDKDLVAAPVRCVRTKP